MVQPQYGPRPRRRGFIPFPIIGPGCCGCGGVFVTGLAVLGAVGSLLFLGEPSAPEAVPAGPSTSVVQELPGQD
ncbi:hypothetical protein [Brachybacterium sp. UNK5269]|uniref:hypothetical protein n=1 Tax=Brachybacterium sp. UNK5269 TaxID=3408576 RepID=UPI003BAFD670